MKDEILTEIARITVVKGFRLTSHAQEQMTARKLELWQVKDILLNPRRLIRVDQKEHTIYKIQGGRYNRKLAVVIKDNVIVITVM